MEHVMSIFCVNHSDTYRKSNKTNPLVLRDYLVSAYKSRQEWKTKVEE